MYSGDEFYGDNETSGIADQIIGTVQDTQRTRRRQSQAPDLDTLMEWLEEGGSEATDGCWVEADGICEHGCRSWLRVYGLI